MVANLSHAGDGDSLMPKLTMDTFSLAPTLAVGHACQVASRDFEGAIQVYRSAFDVFKVLLSKL